jgi:hypothetical protein
MSLRPAIGPGICREDRLRRTPGQIALRGSHHLALEITRLGSHVGCAAIFRRQLPLGTSRTSSERSLDEKDPRLSVSSKRLVGLEPTTFCMASRS